MTLSSFPLDKPPLGGKETTLMARLLNSDACLVSYGAMSKEPLSLPTSLFIFKNLNAKGFWQSRWYNNHTSGERENLIYTLAKLMMEGKVSIHCPINDYVTQSCSSRSQSTKSSRLEARTPTTKRSKKSDLSLPEWLRAGTERRCY